MELHVVHETRTRLRVRLPADADLAGVRASLELLAGIVSTRASQATRSLVAVHDGRRSTRAALLELLRVLPARQPEADEPPARAGESLPLPASALAAALTPLLPMLLRPPAALALVLGHAWAAWRGGADPAVTALDGVAMATNALTGHPATATMSVLLSGIAEHRRAGMLAQTDRLLGHFAPATASSIEVHREDRAVPVPPADVRVGDEVLLRPGAVVPVDGMVVAGSVDVAAEPFAPTAVRRIEAGWRLRSGARVVDGTAALRVERSVGRSRAERLRAHVRHALRTRDAPSSLTPDLDRLLAMPVTAAGLVLALTGDATRTAQMLQADPQMGIALAQPVAREAALYALARHGALLSGLDSIDRLASATTIAFEDVGVLAHTHWRVERVDAFAPTREADVRRWLARLAGHDEPELLAAGVHDEIVVEWRAHGAVLHDPPRVLHVGGAALLERVWKLQLPEPDRRSLVRRIGVVHEGRLLAVVYLRCGLRPDVAAELERLRADGVRRIAVFGEDAGAQPAAALMSIGADAVVCESRAAQRRWLADAAARNERVALVHTGMRDLLPPGGLSLCPIDADAGAHGVLLGEPLPSLVAARTLARRIRRELRWRFGRSVSLNAGLMIAGALQWLPPWSTALIKHGSALWLLEESAGLALLRADARMRG